MREGDTVTYSFTVKNTGDCKLFGVTVSDPLLGGVIWGPADLDAGQEVTFTKTYVVPEGAPTPLINTASATGFDELQKEVGGQGGAEVTIIHPSVALEKSGPVDAAIGDTITYTFKVTNTGDCKLTNVKVTDDKLGDIGTIAELDPLAEATLTKDYAVVLADFPVIVNTGLVTGTPPVGPDVTDEDGHEVNVTSGVPGAGISVTKTLDNSGTVTEGDLVTFTIVVKNTGTSPIPAPVALSDTYDPDYLSFMAASTDPDSSVDDGSLSWADVSGGAGLAAGESVSITLTFLSVKSGSTANGVTVEARDETGAPLTDSDSAPVEIEMPVVPFTPQPTPAQPVSVVQPVTTLPRTGGDFAGLMAIAWVMIPLGLVLITAGLVRKRKRFARV